jgi:anti-sigma regulatory factor (Ser/Thr protein kinase)
MRNGRDRADAITAPDIERLFPGWGVWVSDTGLWWAARLANLSPSQLRAGGRPFLRGQDGEDLMGSVEEQERLLSAMDEASRARPPDQGRPCPGLTRKSARVFSGREDQVAEARRFVSDVIGDVPVRDEAVLLVSELSTNALVHTASGSGGKFEVTVGLRRRSVRVEVSDGGSASGTPAVRPPDALSEDGRGLGLVEVMADRWGCAGDEHGRTVFFELRW